jgi:hypothetical protein
MQKKSRRTIKEGDMKGKKWIKNGNRVKEMERE